MGPSKINFPFSIHPATLSSDERAGSCFLTTPQCDHDRSCLEAVTWHGHPEVPMPLRGTMDDEYGCVVTVSRRKHPYSREIGVACRRISHLRYRRNEILRQATPTSE